MDNSIPPPVSPLNKTIEKPNNPIALKYGLISALVSFAMLMVGFLTDTDPNMPTTSTGMKILHIVLGMGLGLGITMLGIKEDRQQLGGYITFARSLVLALKISIVAGLASIVLMAIYFYGINPDYYDILKAATMENMEQQGLDEAQIEQAMSISSFAFNPIFALVVLPFASAFTGLLFGLIGGLIMKKEPPYQRPV